MREPRSAHDARLVDRFRVAAFLGVLGTGAAAFAGLTLMAADPATGTSAQRVLDRVVTAGAAIGAVSLAGAAIYAEVHNLWRFTSPWLRWTAWAVPLALLGAALLH